MIQPGLYGEKKLLGAKVKIISSPSFSIFEEEDNDKTYIIKEIDYRVTLDGKLSVGIILDGLENTHYLPGDLRIVELPVCNN
jgi:hypothetical protein